MLRLIGSCGWLAALCIVVGAQPASAAKPAVDSPVTVCNQKYALCATASCFYLNGVAYCKCDLEQGKSASITFEFDTPTGTQNVCDLLDEGVNNGFTVSTYSLPNQVTKQYAAEYPQKGGPPPLALYTCPKGSSKGPYAQCDGGVCFESTSGTTFPGLGPVGDTEIVCSCPITDPKKDGPSLGYQISGPWAHQNGKGAACGPNDSQSDCCSTDYLDQFCNASYSPAIPTGATIPVGAPTGAAVGLSLLLDDLRPINTCFDRR